MNRLLPAFMAAVLGHSAVALELTDDNLAAVSRASATLADTASASQWQLLWQEGRRAGVFDLTRDTTRFTLTQAALPALAQDTLRQPTTVHAQSGSVLHLRRDFAPQIVGVTSLGPVTAVCLWLEWRHVSSLLSPSTLQQVQLQRIRPCA